MKNRSFLLALALGFSLFSGAFQASEQDFIPSAAQLAVEELQENGYYILENYMSMQLNNGQNLDVDYVSHVITFHKLDLDQIADCLPSRFSGRCELVFQYIQDLVKLGMKVETDFVLAVIQKSSDYYWFNSNAQLLVKFQETMELLIAKGADRTAYDVFMVEFETYKVDLQTEKISQEIHDASLVTILGKQAQKVENFAKYTIGGALAGVSIAGAITALAVLTVALATGSRDGNLSFILSKDSLERNGRLLLQETAVGLIGGAAVGFLGSVDYNYFR